MQMETDYAAARSPSGSLASLALSQPFPTSGGPSEEKAPLVTLVHRTSVQAVHRLYSGSLSEEKNRLRYGTPAMAIHGHTYDFEVRFKGPVHKATGQIGGAPLLEDIMSMSIHEVLHNKSLDTDVSFFLSRPSTLENVCLMVWRNLAVIMSPHAYDVCEVSVESDPCPRQGVSAVTRTRVSFSGEMMSVPAS